MQLYISKRNEAYVDSILATRSGNDFRALLEEMRMDRQEWQAVLNAMAEYTVLIAQRERAENDNNTSELTINMLRVIQLAQLNLKETAYERE